MVTEYEMSFETELFVDTGSLVIRTMNFDSTSFEEVESVLSELEGLEFSRFPVSSIPQATARKPELDRGLSDAESQVRRLPDMWRVKDVARLLPDEAEEIVTYALSRGVVMIQRSSPRARRMSTLPIAGALVVTHHPGVLVVVGLGFVALISWSGIIEGTHEENVDFVREIWHRLLQGKSGRKR